MRKSGNTRPIFGHNWLEEYRCHFTTVPTTIVTQNPSHSFLPPVWVPTTPRSNYLSTQVRLGVLSEGTIVATHQDSL